MTQLPQPRRRWPLYAAAALALLALAGTAAWAGISTARHDANVSAPATFPSPSPSPTPGVVQFSEQTACMALIPLLSDGTKTVQAALRKPDGSSADWDKVNATLVDLRGVQVAAPASMQPDIDEQIRTLQLLSDMHAGRTNQRELDLSRFKESGIRLASTCRKYATG